MSATTTATVKATLPLRLHYAESLRHWRERFMANRQRIATLYDERFCRMWEFYLVLCEIGFRFAR